MKTLKTYREKLTKALNINSRLTSRLVSEKSKSQIISNTQRSMIQRMEGNAEDMGIISTIRSPSLCDDKRKEELFRRNWKEGLCRKCCREIKASNISDAPQSKNSLFSPVLHVKDYQITKKNSCSDYILEGASYKLTTNCASCQVGFDNGQ